MNRLTWAEIVQRYPCKWMMLAETEDDDYGNIAFARVLDRPRGCTRNVADPLGSVRTCPDEETR